MNTTINVNPDTTLWVAILVSSRLVILYEEKELFSLVILYYQCQSGHNSICFDSQSISIFQERDSGRFWFANQEVLTLTP